MAGNRLGIGFIGSGFVTRFHLQAWRGVRDADVFGVYSPNPEHAAAMAELARELRVGTARAFSSIEEMIAAPEIDCLWLCGPNHQRRPMSVRSASTLRPFALTLRRSH